MKESIKIMVILIAAAIILALGVWFVDHTNRFNVAAQQRETTETEVMTETKTKTVVETEVETKTVVETETETVIETKTETVVETETETETVVETETEPVVKEEIDYDDLYLLAHLIYGEAGDQSDEVQRDVGTVAMNRVAHRAYPNTLYGVIYQSGQYACTWDGNFDKEPSERAYNNARWVLSGGRSLDSEYVYQAQFVQGYEWEWIGSECFGRYIPY